LAEPNDELTNDLEFDLDCPTCGTVLNDESVYETFRVCPSCRRHFWISGRDRLALLIDPGEFSETNSTLASIDPLQFRDPLPLSDRLAEAQDREFLTDAVITGVAEIAGHPNVLVILDFAYWGGTIGVVAGEKITLAMELAATRRIPLIVFCSGGGVHAKEGILSVVQMAKTSNAAARLHRAGIPFISILTHPTTGGVLAGLANQADIVIAEPGTRASVTSEGGGSSSLASAEKLLAHGLIDGVIDRTEMRPWLGSLLAMLADRGVARPTGQLADRQQGNLLAFEETAIARHQDRPTAAEYIRKLMPEFIELHGDRVAADDPGAICGIGSLGGVTFGVIAQNRGEHAPMGAAGFRKAARLMRLAGHLELPLLTLIDSPALPASVDAEPTGIGTALGQALGLLSMLPIPVVSVVIVEANSLAAMALGIGIG
jgi:acetyl-CoA carboxylase carboxyl transferase subunit beta